MTDNRFQIAHSTIYSRKIKQSCKIVQISDLHNCCKGKMKKMIADAVKSAAPDFVVCTGDLFNRKNASDGSDTFELMQTIIESFPVYVIEGNHERALGTVGEGFLSQLKNMGAQLLLDEAVTLNEIRIIGLREQPDCDLIEQLASDDLFNLVLSHRPERFADYIKTKADLVLSGHAHGGQIRIGNIALYAPEQGMFPHYTSGLYAENNTIMLVSRGLGDTIIIPRINNPHELNVIHLEPEKE